MLQARRWGGKVEDPNVILSLLGIRRGPLLRLRMERVDAPHCTSLLPSQPGAAEAGWGLRDLRERRLPEALGPEWGWGAGRGRRGRGVGGSGLFNLLHSLVPQETEGRIGSVRCFIQQISVELELLGMG